MTEDVKKQIGYLIEQAGDPQHRAMLLVLLNMADCLAETSKLNAELVGQVATIKNQMLTGSIKRNIAIRFMDKVMPTMLLGIWFSIGWTWNSINDLQKFQNKIEIEHKLTDKK